MTQTDRPYRVAVWTTGNVIRQAVRVIVSRNDLELVGAFAHSPEKHGLDVGELCGLPQLGVTATSDVEELLARGIDCVVYSPLHLDRAELAAILRCGMNVVTTSEFMTGTNLGPEARSELERAAIGGGATLFGSGMNPGFAQLLAAVATGISCAPRQIIVSESVDVSEFVSDANFEAMGWGRPCGDPGHVDDVRAGTLVFAEAVEVLGLLLGIDSFDEVRCDVTFAHATEVVNPSGMTIPAGHVAGMDVNWSGVLDGRDVVRVQQRWLASAHVDPAWTVEHGYRVEVLGDPNVALKLDIWPTDADLADLTKATMHSIGMRITAVPVVNAIPAVCAAAPGLATYADLRVISGIVAR